MRTKTAPFPFQRDVFEASKHRPSFGLFHDPGLGKSKQVLDYATSLLDAGEITGLLVLAPNGVHANWARIEVPRHVPDDLLGRFRGLAWNTRRRDTTDHRIAAEAVLRGELGLLLMSYDAMMTEEGAKYARRFLDTFRTLLVADESHYLKTPGAQRTKRALAMARYAPYRRAATGTLLANGPFDAYAQLKWIDPTAWLEAGCLTFSAFRATFGVFERRFIAGGSKHFDELVSYRNLPLLHKVVRRWGSVLRKEDVLPDLPPKVYSRRYFDLTTRAATVYRELRDTYMTERSGEMLTAPLAIVRLTRFRQITSGYLPTGDLSTELTDVDDRNPRLEVLVETLEDYRGVPVIVWAEFDRDLDLILPALERAGRKPVRYDGRVSGEARERNLRAFQEDGTADTFVAKPSVGGVGLTLTRARVEVFYNTGWQPAMRGQAEDRAHRIGTPSSVLIIDLVARGTVDERVLDALAAKVNIIEAVMTGRLFDSNPPVVPTSLFTGLSSTEGVECGSDAAATEEVGS